MEKEHIRTPILQILRKSPIAGLEKHYKYVITGIKALDKAVKYYLDDKPDRFKEYAEKVYRAEDLADKIKGNIRNHLPKFIFIPIDKGDFLELLKEADGILDTAEDIVVLMEMKQTTIPEDIKENFQAVMKKAMETVETLWKALDMFRFMLESSFGGRTRQDIKKEIHKIHHLEHESDLIEKKISKQLFNSKDLDPLSVIHILKVVDRMGCIADHAENATDRIRTMLAK
jgi:predicted phosphate transport protein (TIGR00153 family)